MKVPSRELQVKANHCLKERPHTLEPVAPTSEQSIPYRCLVLRSNGYETNARGSTSLSKFYLALNTTKQSKNIIKRWKWAHLYMRIEPFLALHLIAQTIGKFFQRNIFFVTNGQVGKFCSVGNNLNESLYFGLCLQRK